MFFNLSLFELVSVFGKLKRHTFTQFEKVAQTSMFGPFLSFARYLGLGFYHHTHTCNRLLVSWLPVVYASCVIGCSATRAAASIYVYIFHWWDTRTHRTRLCTAIAANVIIIKVWRIFDHRTTWDMMNVCSIYKTSYFQIHILETEREKSLRRVFTKTLVPWWWWPSSCGDRIVFEQAEWPKTKWTVVCCQSWAEYRVSWVWWFSSGQGSLTLKKTHLSVCKTKPMC